MALPAYRQDLDIVVEAPDGILAAAYNCWLDEESGTGLFEPVSTHAGHRRRGLARAMMHYGMRWLQAHRASEARVGSFSGNPAVQHTDAGYAQTKRAADEKRDYAHRVGDKE